MCQGAHTAEAKGLGYPPTTQREGVKAGPWIARCPGPIFLVSVLARSIQLNDTTSYEEAVRILLEEQNGEKPYYVGPAKVA